MSIREEQARLTTSRKGLLSCALKFVFPSAAHRLTFLLLWFVRSIAFKVCSWQQKLTTHFAPLLLECRNITPRWQQLRVILFPSRDDVRGCKKSDPVGDKLKGSRGRETTGKESITTTVMATCKLLKRGTSNRVGKVLIRLTSFPGNQECTHLFCIPAHKSLRVRACCCYSISVHVDLGEILQDDNERSRYRIFYHIRFSYPHTFASFVSWATSCFTYSRILRVHRNKAFATVHLTKRKWKTDRHAYRLSLPLFNHH